MSAEPFVDTQPHEGDLHLVFQEHGLSPYYALDSIRKDYDGWQTEGKPTAGMSFRGVDWALCYDYDTGGLDPWEHESYHLETVPEFRIYFVAKDELYDGERADQSSRVKGGTMTIRPRWPNLTSDGRDVSVPDLGGPYVDVQVQASNIRHSDYRDIVETAMAAFGINDYYFRNPHEISNWGDMAAYVRLRRDRSGPVYAPDGPLARMHNLLEGGQSGFREHREDHRKLPGFYVSTKVPTSRVGDLVRGHTLGKEVKHYYPKHPEAYGPSDALYHPKLEVSLQRSITDDTVYWEDTQDAYRELEELLFNTLEWADLTTRAGDLFVSDAYFSKGAESRRSRKLVDDPLPRFEDEQLGSVMRVWGNRTAADRDVISHLLTDGGKPAPADVAENTGYTYRTVRAVVDRCKDVINHTYGQLEIESKYQQEELLKRVQAEADNFTSTLADTALTVADVAENRSRSAWSRARRKWNVDVLDDVSGAKKRVNVGYVASSRQEAKRIVNQLLVAWQGTFDRGTERGVEVLVNLQTGGTARFPSFRANTKGVKLHREKDTPEEIRRKVESVDWEAHGYTDVTTG